MNCPGHILNLSRQASQLSRASRAPRRARNRLSLRAQRHHAWLDARPRIYARRRPHLCTPDQIEDEVVSCLEFAIDVLKTFGFEKYEAEALHLG